MRQNNFHWQYKKSFFLFQKPKKDKFTHHTQIMMLGWDVSTIIMMFITTLIIFFNIEKNDTWLTIMNEMNEWKTTDKNNEQQQKQITELPFEWIILWNSNSKERNFRRKFFCLFDVWMNEIIKMIKTEQIKRIFSKKKSYKLKLETIGEYLRFYLVFIYPSTHLSMTLKFSSSPLLKKVMVYVTYSYFNLNNNNDS